MPDNPLTEADLAAIEERASAASPGPWITESSSTYQDELHLAIRTTEPLPEHPWSPRFIAWLCGTMAHLPSSVSPRRHFCEKCGAFVQSGRQAGVDIRIDEKTESDGEFIAHSREDIPRLIAEVRRLQEENAALSTVPATEKTLASLPVDSPRWHSSDGTEYFYNANQKYVVLNERLAGKRERIICRVLESVVVEE